MARFRLSSGDLLDQRAHQYMKLGFFGRLRVDSYGAGTSTSVDSSITASSPTSPFTIKSQKRNFTLRKKIPSRGRRKNRSGCGVKSISQPISFLSLSATSFTSPGVVPSTMIMCLTPQALSSLKSLEATPSASHRHGDGDWDHRM